MKNLFCFASFLLPLFLNAQTGWLRHFSPTDMLHSVQVLPDGYAFFAQTNGEIYRISTDLAGNTLDSLPLGPTPNDLVPATGGGFFKSFLFGTYIRLEKWDETGNLLWDTQFPDTLLLNGAFLAALPDGGGYLASAAAQQLPLIPYHSTAIQRFSADGERLWLHQLDGLSGWGSTSSRSINDIAVMPDSSCLVLCRDHWDNWHGAGRLLRVRPDGLTDYGLDFAPPWSYSSSALLITGRPTADSLVLTAGFKSMSSGGGHPSSTRWGFTALVDDAGNVPDGADYPSIYSQMTTIYAPEPLAVLPTPSGDMIVMGQKFPQTFLWRGSYNLQDTLWQQALTPEGGFFSYKIIYPNRLMYNTPDQGAVLGGVDSAGIFLLKINAAGQYQTTGTEPSDPEPPMGSLRVAPNPARDHAFVFFPTPDYDQLIVTDLAGQKVRVFELPAGRTEFVLDCRQMPPGVYGLTARRPDGAMVFGKLSVQ